MVARGTTPTFCLTFEDASLDLTQAEHVYVTFRSGSNVITKTGDDLTVSEKEIQVFLTQEETLKLYDVQIQANWTTNGGVRSASEVVSYRMSDQLLEKVVE